MTEILAAIPSPQWSGFSLGPVTIHAYALCILAGIAAALWLTNRRWQAKGGTEDDLWTIAVWAIPAGIIGGRLYHVFSTPAPYFGPQGTPIDALKIWNGGLGIWGAVALGVLVVFFVCRAHGIRFLSFLDAAAPGLILAQAIGRWGNWFNQELFGAPTTLPWGLRIDREIGGSPNPNWPGPEYADGTLFHPTFLYESLWNILGCVLLLWAARRFALGWGQVFFLYICFYTAGRVWIEALRIDYAEHILGLRLNVWVSILVFALGAALFAASRIRHRGDSEPGAHVPGSKADLAARAASEDESAPRRGEAAQAGSGSEQSSPQAPRGSGSARTRRQPEEPGRFGDHGAMTSNISIVPQVPKRSDPETRGQ